MYFGRLGHQKITDEMMDYYNRMEGRLTSGLESVRRNSEVHSGIESA